MAIQDAEHPRRRGAREAGRGQPLRRRLPRVSRTRRTTRGSSRALEINLRVLGTTHPFLALQFLTGGTLDPGYGPVRVAERPRRSTTWPPTTCAPRRYRGVLPEDLIDIVTDNGLHYSHRTESGVLFHLIGALSEYGKLGLTVIANSPEEVEDLYGARSTCSPGRRGSGTRRARVKGQKGQKRANRAKRQNRRSEGAKKLKDEGTKGVTAKVARGGA